MCGSFGNWRVGIKSCKNKKKANQFLITNLKIELMEIHSPSHIKGSDCAIQGGGYNKFPVVAELDS